MNILLTSHGSTGDIFPVIALGKALLNRGHAVSFACAPLFREAIEDAGITFLHLPPDWEQEVFAECMRELDRQPNVLMLLKQIYRSGLPFMGELIDEMESYIPGHDIVIGSYVFPHVGILSQKHGVPFAVLVFSHNVVPSPDVSPELIPSLRGLPKSVQEGWNNFWWRTISHIIDAAVNSVIAPVLKEKSLPRMKHFLTKPADLCLLGVSKELMPSARIPEHFKTVGYLRNQPEFDSAIEEELDVFCQGEEVPVLNFGSVSFDHIQDVMSRFEKNWEHGRKIILQSGWAGLSLENLRSEFKVVGKMSHDQLLRRASVVIHHGGAGTTASVFHAGKPHIVVPHFGDQYFWASQVKQKKCGISIPQRKWPECLPRAVRKILKSDTYRKHAQAFSARLKVEDGPGQAVEVIENYLAGRL